MGARRTTTMAAAAVTVAIASAAAGRSNQFVAATGGPNRRNLPFVPPGAELQRRRSRPTERRFAPPPASSRRGGAFAGLPRRPASDLPLSRYDNLVSGIAEISMGTSLGVLWSEYAVLTTGCGPLHFSDGLERLCYQGVLLSAGAALFVRVAFGRSVVSTCEDSFGYLGEATLWQVRVAEWLSVMAVAGAFVALAAQIYNGERMEGLSGIDVEMCRAVRDL